MPVSMPHVSDCDIHGVLCIMRYNKVGLRAVALPHSYGVVLWLLLHGVSTRCVACTRRVRLHAPLRFHKCLRTLYGTRLRR